MTLHTSPRIWPRCAATVSIAMTAAISFEARAAPSFAPQSGAVCSEVFISGALPSIPYSNLHVTFNGMEAPGLKVVPILIGVGLPRKYQTGLEVTVPGDASSGEVIVSFDEFLFRRSLVTQRIALGQFQVTGATIPQPIIKSFSATPTFIDPGAAGSKLSWSITGPATDVELNGNSEGFEIRNGLYLYSDSAQVNPLATTTYRLVAGNRCASRVSEAVVTVSQPLQITVLKNPMTFPAGTISPTATVTIPEKAADVVVWCDQLNGTNQCNILDIKNPTTSAPLVLTPTGLNSESIMIHALLWGPSQTASTILDLNIPVQSGQFGVPAQPGQMGGGPLQFQHTTGAPSPAMGLCSASLNSTTTATLSCTGYSQQVQKSFRLDTRMGSAPVVGGVAAAPVGNVVSPLNQLFVVADYIPTAQNNSGQPDSIAYYSFELPQQLSGGLSLTPPPSPSLVGLLNFPITGSATPNSIGNPPSFWPSPDGSIGMISWDVAAIDPAHPNCRSTATVYNLYSGANLGTVLMAGGVPTATISGGQVMLENDDGFLHSVPTSSNSSAQDCSSNPPKNAPAINIH